METDFKGKKILQGNTLRGTKSCLETDVLAGYINAGKNLTPWYVGEKILTREVWEIFFFTQTESHIPHSKFKWSAPYVSMLKRKGPHAFQ